MRHDFKKIEPKWQAKWEESKIFRAVDGSEKPKFYGLVEFPYPSGAGYLLDATMITSFLQSTVSSIRS